MPRKRPPPREHRIDVTLEGTSYTGSWSVDRGMIMVSFGMAGSETTQVGNLPPESLAKLMMGNLVAKHRKAAGEERPDLARCVAEQRHRRLPLERSADRLSPPLGASRLP